MDWRERIEIRADTLVGKPIVRGTRIAVEFILDMLASGVSETEILTNYPRLQREDILACVAYAVELVKSERVFPLSALEMRLLVDENLPKVAVQVLRDVGHDVMWIAETRTYHCR